MPRLAIIVIAAALLAGCGHGPRTPYQECLAAPREHREGRSRRGGWTPQLGFSWGDAYSGGTLDVVDSVEECLHYVTVKQGGRTFRSRGYESVDHFVTDRRGRRWSFEGYRDHVFVVIDGVEGPPLRDVVWFATFSPSGNHVAYIARDESGSLVMLDGRVAMRAQEIKPNNFIVLDDGRFGVVRSAAEHDRWEVAFGGWVSPTFDSVVELSFWVHEPRGRLAFVGRSGSEQLAVIDGKVVEAPGGVYGKEIRFSEDGDHFAFVSRVRGATGKSEDDHYYAIWDSRAFPLTGAGNLVRFLGERPVFSVSDPAYVEETHYVVLGVPTPSLPPSVDEYRRVNPWSHWTSRVRIGDSLGPRFDELKPGSLEILGDGRVRYVGTRGGNEIEVIDNRLPGDAEKRPAQVAQ